MLHAAASLLSLSQLFTSSSTACQVTTGGTCVTDGAGNYGNNERCTITAQVALTLSTTGTFSTESYWDSLTISGVRYSGSSGPRNIQMTAGQTFRWSSDGSVARTGWTVCGTPAVPPSPQPMPPPLPPPPPRPIVVNNLGADCWIGCSGVQGACPGFCGADGACCKVGAVGSPAACGSGTQGCPNIHCCVAATPMP